MSDAADYDIAELEEQLAEDKALEEELQGDFLSGNSPEIAEMLGNARAARKATENALRAARAAQSA
ncbi:hypothetical protein D3C80_1859230 [compost metagenome]